MKPIFICYNVYLKKYLCEHGETSRHFVETGICTACNGTGLKSN